jgi:hypothetical protein
MATSEIAQPQEDVTEVLVPSAEEKVVVIGKDDYKFEYTQRPLSFFQKLEVFSVLGRALEQAMSGPDGLNLGELFEGPSPLGESLNSENYRDADTVVKAIAKLAQYAPDLVAEFYCVILGVPRGQRALVTEVMELPENEGGLSDEDGFGILDTFIDQNWDVMVDFFNNRIIPLVNKVSNKVNKDQESQPSKPSKTTRRTTRKA